LTIGLIFAMILSKRFDEAFRLLLFPRQPKTLSLRSDDL
jgi:hypothetical protein